MWIMQTRYMIACDETIGMIVTRTNTPAVRYRQAVYINSDTIVVRDECVDTVDNA